MILLIHSETSARTLERNLGRSEYSYYFVLRLFRPLLATLGEVIEIEDPLTEVDAAFDRATEAGERAVFLCFNPPHKVPTGLRCPTIPVFAWEFDTIPDEVWRNDPRQDWVAVLRMLGRAIVHSSHTVEAVRRSLGSDFPVVSIPAPVWDRYGPKRGLVDERPIERRATAITLTTPHLDSRTVDLGNYDRFAPEADRMRWAREIMARVPVPRDIVLDGIVYTTVLNPFDGRKRCFDMIDNFCWAFRDRPDATLVLKVTQNQLARVMSALIGEYIRNMPFRCRVLAIQGLLPQETYDTIVRATTYVVNCSAGEGQCLPLMEFMSCGKPAVAPRSTAMLDYVTEDNAFVVDDHPEPTIWPHDKRAAFRALRRRLDTSTLVRAFQESFRVARTDPARYARMSEAASRSLQRNCSDEVTLARLRAALDRRETGVEAHGPAADDGSERAETLPALAEAIDATGAWSGGGA